MYVKEKRIEKVSTIFPSVRLLPIAFPLLAAIYILIVVAPPTPINPIVVNALDMPLAKAHKPPPPSRLVALVLSPTVKGSPVIFTLPVEDPLSES